MDYLKKMFPTFDDKMIRETLEELKNDEKRLGSNEHSHQNDQGMLERSPDSKIKE